jgi:two-component system, response regulator
MIDGTILLVDDSPDDVALTLRAFRVNNITNQVDVASDGEQALDYLLPDGEVRPMPVLILLDINLPKVSGLEVLRRIRTDDRTRYLPVVVLSTSSEDRDIVESYHLGANSYIRKPVVFNEFVDAVKVLGLYWLLVNQAVLPPKGG